MVRFRVTDGILPSDALPNGNNKAMDKKERRKLWERHFTRFEFLAEENNYIGKEINYLAKENNYIGKEINYIARKIIFLADIIYFFAGKIPSAD
ncbi:MAG: hypothetical protein ACOC2E_04055 [Bacteroidota bacterium]